MIVVSFFGSSSLRFACLSAISAVCLVAQLPSVASNNFVGTGSVSSPAPAVRPPISTELRGDIFMARKMYREAIDMYRKGAPDSPVLNNKIGIAYHQMLRLDLARKNYEHAIKLDKKYSEAINNLGTIFYAEKSYRRSIGCYKRALRYTTPTASIYANMGAAYFGRKDYKHAAEYYEEALRLDPDVFEHHNSFGTIMQERTVEERATYHLYLAKMYAKNGRLDRAIIYLRKALEEGVKDREKIPGMPEFAGLKTNPEFAQLLLENPKPL
jgi:tetratricopeptide (TPR) repeat protein